MYVVSRLPSLPSMQCVVSELCGNRIADRAPGHLQGNQMHPGPESTSHGHCGPLQSVHSGHHSDGRKAKVSLTEVRMVFWLGCWTLLGSTPPFGQVILPVPKLVYNKLVESWYVLMNWFLGADISTAYFKGLSLCSPVGRCHGGSSVSHHLIYSTETKWFLPLFFSFCMYIHWTYCFTTVQLFWIHIMTYSEKYFSCTVSSTKAIFQKTLPNQQCDVQQLRPKGPEVGSGIIRTFEMVSYRLWPALFCLNLLIYYICLALSAAKLVDIKLELGNIQILWKYWDLISDK